MPSLGETATCCTCSPQPACQTMRMTDFLTKCLTWKAKRGSKIMTFFQLGKKKKQESDWLIAMVKTRKGRWLPWSSKGGKWHQAFPPAPSTLPSPRYPTPHPLSLSHFTAPHPAHPPASIRPLSPSSILPIPPLPMLTHPITPSPFKRQEPHSFYKLLMWNISKNINKSVSITEWNSVKSCQRTVLKHSVKA